MCMVNAHVCTVSMYVDDECVMCVCVHGESEGKCVYVFGERVYVLCVVNVYVWLVCMCMMSGFVYICVRCVAYIVRLSWGSFYAFALAFALRRQINSILF